MPITPISRRAVLKNLLLGAPAAAAAVGAVSSRSAAPEKVNVNDPAARAVGYVENASQVDIKKYPGYVQGSNCDNCLLLQGKPGNNYRPCSLFQGKLVAVSGWCTGWTAEM
jgi:hypothetical protein